MQNARFLKSIIFVIIQFLCLGLIAITGPLFPANEALLFIELVGIGLGIWAILSMRIGNFNIAPDPLIRSKLVKSGPYRLIRHPMYLALLLTTYH
jgi:protein-S-isoprenylcysteine O-methyltransferase Ste14